MSILKKLKDCEESQIPLDLHNTIIQKLSQVLIKVFNLNHFDVNGKELLIFNTSNPDELSYTFLGQDLKLTTYSNRVSVTMYFSQNHKLNIPVGSGWCSITLDENLNYSTKFIYTLNGYSSGSIDFNNCSLPAIFSENNNEFFTPLMKMFDFCSKKEDLFYDVFDEYPSHEDVIEDVNNFKAFLLMYYEQYTNNYDLLKLKILLFDMKEI